MTADLTLAAIVDANPGAARILEHHQLDYCCGGQRTLDEACAEGGVDLAVVLGALDAVQSDGAADWASMDVGSLVDHIEGTHHRYLHDEMPRLAALAAKVVGVHGDCHPELRGVAATYEELRLDLEPHLMKEERVLFPMIRQLATVTETPGVDHGTIAGPIRMMLLEHDGTGAILARLREVAGGFELPADACASYGALYRGLAELEADTHLHIHKENNVLFPAVLALDEQLSSR